MDNGNFLWMGNYLRMGRDFEMKTRKENRGTNNMNKNEREAYLKGYKKGMIDTKEVYDNSKENRKKIKKLINKLKEMGI